MTDNAAAQPATTAPHEPVKLEIPNGGLGIVWANRNR